MSEDTYDKILRYLIQKPKLSEEEVKHEAKEETVPKANIRKRSNRSTDTLDTNELLKVLIAVKNGDFTARMKEGQPGQQGADRKAGPHGRGQQGHQGQRPRHAERGCTAGAHPRAGAAACTQLEKR